ncbi:Glucose/ribitol dehydrogenase [Apiospora arundinis]
MEKTETAEPSQDEGHSALLDHDRDELEEYGNSNDSDDSEESDNSEESNDSDEEPPPSYWSRPEQVEKQLRLLDIDPPGSEPFLCSQCRATNLSAALDHTSKASQGGANPIDVAERVGLDPDCALCSLFARTFLSEVDENVAQFSPWKLSAFSKRNMLVDSRIRYLFYPVAEAAILHSGDVRFVQHINTERVEREGYLAFARTSDLRDMLENHESTEEYPLSRFIGAQYDPGMVREWLEACDIELDGDFCIPGMRVIDCRSYTIVNYVAGMEYVALSYVWSLASRDMVTVGCRQSDETSALPLPHTIPRVVSNAMQVVTDLGYQYLWVDQFCIDQSAGQAQIGDHISKMDLIYSNALVTIIAASSEGGPAWNEKIGTVEDDLTIFNTPPAFKYALPSTVWHSRGWCFQESVLAPRRLYFMDYELVFQSEEIHASDSYPEPIGNSELIDDTACPANPSLAWSFWDDQSKTYDPDDAMERFCDKDEHYQALLEVYTSKKLTMDSDSINGFAGAMKVYCRHDPMFKTIQGIPIFDVSAMPIASVQGVKTLLTFQNEAILCGLCWAHHRIWVEETPVRRDCFPSWTWAGWGGQINAVLAQITF